MAPQPHKNRQDVESPRLNSGGDTEKAATPRRPLPYRLAINHENTELMGHLPTIGPEAPVLWHFGTPQSEICFKYWRSMDELRRHARICHQTAVDGDGVIRWSPIPGQAPSRLHHQRNVEPTSDLCNIRYVHWDGLTQHIHRAHDTELRLSAADLTHYGVNTGTADEVPLAWRTPQGALHRCFVCGRLCCNKRTLMTHIHAQHFDSMLHTCVTCPARFSEQAAFRRHMASAEHTGALPFASGWCPYRTLTRNSLRRHT